MDRLLFGDNQFFGQERARGTEDRGQDQEDDRGNAVRESDETDIGLSRIEKVQLILTHPAALIDRALGVEFRRLVRAADQVGLDVGRGEGRHQIAQ